MTDATQQPTSERVNDLYWNGEQTIDELVESLGISRNTLYSAVRPLPAGASCPSCGERMVFTNRTNRAHETATCLSCGRENDVRIAVGERDTRDRARAEWEDQGIETPRRAGRRPLDLQGVEAERVALVGGAAALGVMLGAAAVRAMRS